jgi:hypothetical protein
VAGAAGAIVCEEVKVGGKRRFRKGQRVTPEDLAVLAEVDRPLHLIRLDPDDVHEDEAGQRLARAMAGEGIATQPPVQSRVNLVATGKGLLRVDADALLALNRLPGIAIFTLLDRQPVLPGKIVAGAKITPVAVPRATIEDAERIAARSPVVAVMPFQSLKVGVITTEGLEGSVRDRFRATVEGKVGWYGGRVIGYADLPSEPGAVGAAIERFAVEGADVILAGGGNTIDPLDATLQALPAVGAEVVAFGAPAHPGSMFWLAYRGEMPIFNLASCSMYSKATVADLVLPSVMAGERVTSEHIAQLGYGGLLDRDMQFRFPPYEAEQANEDEA